MIIMSLSEEMLYSFSLDYVFLLMSSLSVTRLSFASRKVVCTAVCWEIFYSPNSALQRFQLAVVYRFELCRHS